MALNLWILWSSIFWSKDWSKIAVHPLPSLHLHQPGASTNGPIVSEQSPITLSNTPPFCKNSRIQRPNLSTTKCSTDCDCGLLGFLAKNIEEKEIMKKSVVYTLFSGHIWAHHMCINMVGRYGQIMHRVFSSLPRTKCDQDICMGRGTKMSGHI